MKILIVDGQGGRLGKQIIEAILPGIAGHELIAVGTNALATAAMLKAGAPQAATGENALCINAASADLIVGPIGIISANSLLGEVTPRMALAVGKSEAHKLLIPLNRCNLEVISLPKNATMSDMVAQTKVRILELLKG
ncbi:MAG: DUF3842 family protein [Firmicutes bacterium]|nr:DUF3842 family protein [Bacillota bacterium]